MVKRSSLLGALSSGVILGLLFKPVVHSCNQYGSQCWVIIDMYNPLQEHLVASIHL